jgi:hypothetical protein
MEACLRREGLIKRALQLEFERHRGRMQTRWEYAVSDILRELLVDRFEYIAQGHEGL